MTDSLSQLGPLLRELRPVLNAGVYWFLSVPTGSDVSALLPVASFQEGEGLTLIVEEQRALQAGFAEGFRAAWITLTVRSELTAVGLTAAVSGALAHAGISCNMVAAYFHDHLFVPVEHADRALAALERLQRQAASAT
ncbi:MAG TPA: ACT domain-containing protein [Polyangiaceae bacterium]|jgi:hypothetical protein|nr:ACT domain-containing protein [Polyangiaceae bacterium]